MVRGNEALAWRNFCMSKVLPPIADTFTQPASSADLVAPRVIFWLALSAPMSDGHSKAADHEGTGGSAFPHALCVEAGPVCKADPDARYVGAERSSSTGLLPRGGLAVDARLESSCSAQFSRAGDW